MAMTDDPNDRGRDGRCGGKKRQGDGGPCTQPAGWGTDHPGFGACKLHGGSTPTHRVEAQRAAAAEAVVTFGLPRTVAPQDALLEEVHRTAGAVEWLGTVVAGLERNEVVWGLTRIKEGGDDRGTTHEAGVNVWVKLWMEQRAHLLKVCAAAIAAGIEERRVRLAEGQGQLLATVIRNVLGDLALTPEQQQLVATVVPRHLHAAAELEAGGAA